MAAQIAFEQLTLPDYVISSARNHLGDPSEKFVLPVVLDHAVQLTDILQVLAHAIQSFSQVF